MYIITVSELDIEFFYTPQKGPLQPGLYFLNHLDDVMTFGFLFKIILIVLTIYSFFQSPQI